MQRMICIRVKQYAKMLKSLVEMSEELEEIKIALEKSANSSKAE